MDHVAIMKASWHMTEKIARGEKTIESRWLKHKTSPWNKFSANDRVFFKDSSKPVSVVTAVERVEYIENADGSDLIARYGKGLCLTEAPKNKPFAVLIFLKNPKHIEPFHVTKKGFGNMAAWITINSIEDIQI